MTDRLKVREHLIADRHIRLVNKNGISSLQLSHLLEFPIGWGEFVGYLPNRDPEWRDHSRSLLCSFRIQEDATIVALFSCSHPYQVSGSSYIYGVENFEEPIEVSKGDLLDVIFSGFHRKSTVSVNWSLY